ncbi:MAG: phage tail protein, partial [Chakrabartia sp.]
MATLILTSIGTLVGGPLGGALGSFLGSQIDQRLLAPKGRRGPRLGDLSVQSSSYGAQIPKLFGRVRVSGTVIWSTDLREDRRKISAGKGQPKQTVYSYSASFAVALSARRAVRIERIWADGKLLRGAAGDFKTQTGFRFYNGTEAQSVDPLIAAAEGISNTPAYRGLAYGVFEDFQLGDYGNRIPSLSFEVVADDGDISVGAILEGLAPVGLSAVCPTVFGGFAASGDSVRGVAETIGSALALYAHDDGVSVLITESGQVGPAVFSDDMGAAAGEKGGNRSQIERQSNSTNAGARSVAYYEIARDYQAGFQRVRREGGGRREDRIDLPAALTPTQARRIASHGLALASAHRARLKISLPWSYLGIAPGDQVRVPHVSGLWQVKQAALDAMVVSLNLVRLPETQSAGVEAEPGRSVQEVDAVHGPTTVHIIDLPMLNQGLATAPIIVVAAAGISAGWRRAAVTFSIDDGASWTDAGATAASATMGQALNVLNPSSAAIYDWANSVDVVLLNPSMQLVNGDDRALLSGANLAMLGDELIQFRSAQLIAPGRYRLSGLLRGRRATEAAISSHRVGERFILLERDTLLTLPLTTEASRVQIMASGVGDITGSAEASLIPARVALQ